MIRLYGGSNPAAPATQSVSAGPKPWLYWPAGRVPKRRLPPATSRNRRKKADHDSGPEVRDRPPGVGTTARVAALSVQPSAPDRDSNHAAGSASEDAVLGRCRPQHRIEQRLVARPIGAVPLPVDIHDQHAAAFGIVGAERRDMRPVIVAGDDALIVVDERDVGVGALVVGEHLAQLYEARP